MSKKLTSRQERSRAVTCAGLGLMILLFAWSWYQHGWQAFAVELLALMLGIVILAGTILWVNMGKS